MRKVISIALCAAGCRHPAGRPRGRTNRRQILRRQDDQDHRRARHRRRLLTIMPASPGAISARYSGQSHRSSCRTCPAPADLSRQPPCQCRTQGRDGARCAARQHHLGAGNRRAERRIRREKICLDRPHVFGRAERPPHLRKERRGVLRRSPQTRGCRWRRRPDIRLHRHTDGGRTR